MAAAAFPNVGLRKIFREVNKMIFQEKDFTKRKVESFFGKRILLFIH